MALSIHVITIDGTDMRYPTVGDYIGTPNARVVMVAEMGDWRKELLVAVHEIIEQSLCFDRGISEKAITAFDKHFEATKGNTHEEPGN
jgi:hypothetical protein